MTGVQNFALLVFAFLIILLMPALPLWLVLAALLLSLWKLWILRVGTGQPSRLLISALGTLMLALVFLDSAPIFSRESMISIVGIGSLLFILDRPHARQVMLVHGSFYGLLIALLVMRGSPLPLFLYFLVTIVIFFSLLLHHLPPSTFFSLWPLGRNILKISLPVSAILLPIYFFFPEIRSQTSDSAVSGLSDVLEPGRIANLALSDRTAFRVRLLDELAPGQSLYWRSSVLEESFGMIWRKRRPLDMQDSALPQRSEGISYEMIPETRMGLALPLLEHTSQVQGVGQKPLPIWWHADLRMFQSQNDIIRARAALQDRFLARDKPNHEPLKIQISGRVQQLVDHLKTMPAEAQVDELLQLLRGFTYTLQPGTLNRDDPLDDFLFEKKRGFCEHFAAAFASTLQLAGTPARVITGYEGGVFIGSSNFMLVRDSDAHAWTEVYFNGFWQRIDPSSLARPSDSRAESRIWVTALPAAWFAYGLRLTTMKLREWTQEFEFFWLGLVGILTVTVPLQLWRTQKKKLNRPIWQAAMDRFLLDLLKLGIQREKHEGMRDFLRRAEVLFPAESQRLDELSRLYQSVLFGPDSNPEDAKALLLRFHRLRRTLSKTRPFR